MVIFLLELKEFLEEKGVNTKYIKKGMLYVGGDERYSKFKIKIRDPDKYESPYTLTKERTGQNIYGKKFKDAEKLVEFLLEKQSD